MGVIISKAQVPNIIPPITPMANDFEPLEPTPEANSIGNKPNIIVADVIMIGRSLTFAACLAAETMSRPSRRIASTAYSVNKIAVFDKSPINIITPVCIYILFSNPKAHANRKLPVSPNGTENITAKGISRLSYKAASIRYMNNIHIAKIHVELLPVASSSLVIPPNSKLYPVGSVSAATSLIALIA